MDIEKEEADDASKIQEIVIKRDRYHHSGA